MGTRADFYIGRGEKAEWLGSIAWDGYPAGIDPALLTATDETAYRAAVATKLADDDSGTTPDMGWPWPWGDSGTTDYAYALDDGTVWASSFGHEWWFKATEEEPEERGGKNAVFPDMTAVQRVTLGERSGVILL